MNVDKFYEMLKNLQENSSLLDDLEDIAKESAVALGLLYIIPEFPHAYKPVPLTLLPTFIKGTALNKLVTLQPHINLLMHRVACDKAFLTSILKGAAQVDPFTKSLLDIHDHVDNHSQWELGLLRSDYMLQIEEPCKNLSEILNHVTYKMVEMNTISVGPAGISSFAPQVHARILQYLGFQTEDKHAAKDDTLALYGGALLAAHSVYCREYPSAGTKVMLLVVHKGFEFNVIDQRFTENASGVRTLRRTTRDISRTMRMSVDKALIVEGYEVSIVYYRTAYSPNHYASQQDWETRKMIELSRAIKCPSVAYQLAGCKKIQQELSRPEVLTRFLPETTIREELMSTFVSQWDVSDPAAAVWIDRALVEPGKYVLKPNREGGGNNFYNQEMVTKIHEIRGTSQAAAFILMDKIQAPILKNIMLRQNRSPELMDTMNEIGVFGVILAKGEQILLNGASDQLLVRCKASHANEGGLAIGLSCLSSAFVV